MNSQPFHDHFSDRATGYALYRPVYPVALAKYLSKVTREAVGNPGSRGEDVAGLVWEAGCGSGQLTEVLAEHFEKVIATDASADQLAQARPHPRVEYRRARAEASGLPEHCADLAVSAQAAHWFDLEGYYKEVKRVLRPGGVVALIVYGIHHTDSLEVDRIVGQYYRQTLANHWPPQRRHVEEGYRLFAFPFDEFTTPALEVTARWTLPEMVGYIETWSASRALEQSQGRNEIDAMIAALGQAWGEPDTVRIVRWPLSIRAGRCVQDKE